MSASTTPAMPVGVDTRNPLPLSIDVGGDTAGSLGSSELLSRLISDFERSEDSSAPARALAERDSDFFHGQQLTAVEIAALKARRQPPSINNYVRRKISLLLGTERRGRSDVKCFPRNPQHADMADVATQALRFVSDSSRFDLTRSLVYEDMLVFGFGAVECVVEPRVDRDGYDIVIRHVPWSRVYYDPHSSQASFKDAEFCGTVIWSDRAAVMRQYPGSEGVLEASFATVGQSQTYDDKPTGVGWADNRRTRVRTVQAHYKENGDWYTATFTRGGFLEGPMKSPYVDHRGKTACPLIMQSAYVDRNNNRYGVVRDMISLQESINKRESKLLHLLNVNQLVFENGAVDDVDLARREAAKPDGAIQKNRGFEFEIRRDQGEVAGHFQLLQYAVAQMNVTGPNAAMSGKDPREQSGRAILAQASGGMTEIEPLTDALRQFTHRVMEKAWNDIRRYWTGPEFIRVTDDTQSCKFVGINLPVTLADELAQMNPADAAQATQQLQLQPNDPRLQQVIRIQNDIDSCDVEISIEEGPDTPTLQIEQWQAFLQLPAQILQQFPPEYFIQANPAIRDKDRLTKILSDHQASQAAGQQAAQAAQQAMQQAQVAKANADAQDKAAQAADRQAQTVERLHGIAKDHAAAMHTPIVPGVGPVQPADNPLLQQPHPDVQQAQIAGMKADARATDAQAANAQAMAMERLHGMAMDHAQALHTPIVPGVGAVTADQNPLLQGGGAGGQGVDGSAGQAGPQGPQMPQNGLMPQR